MKDKKAVFFCSAVKEIDPIFNQAARDAVRAACLCGYDIVSGGTIKGTMDVVSDEAAKCGALVHGVLPRFMKGLEHPQLTDCVWTDTMSERKEAMREGTCLAVALPGGIGTLDELSETYCLAKMHIYPGKVIAFNLEGFYNAYRDQLDTCVRYGMLDAASREMISFPETIEEFKKLI